MKSIVLLLVIVQNLDLIEAIPDCPEGQTRICGVCVANNLVTYGARVYYTNCDGTVRCREDGWLKYNEELGGAGQG